jgi:hypothetical protein
MKVPPDLAKGGPRTQLAALVETLDRLTDKPLHLTLDDKEKAEVRKQLQGLGGKELKDADAGERLHNLLQALEAHKQVFVAAGYPWPEAGAVPSAQPSENPFDDPRTREHLQALQGRLAKGAEE